LKLDENIGNTVHDISQSGLNGTSYFEIWENDGINNTLVEGTDYSRVGIIFTLLNGNYSYAGINASYIFQTDTEGTSAVNQSLIGLADFSDFIPIIIIGFVSAIIITIILVSFNRRKVR